MLARLNMNIVLSIRGCGDGLGCHDYIATWHYLRIQSSRTLIWRIKLIAGTIALRFGWIQIPSSIVNRGFESGEWL